ncbi:ubiquitin-like domain-containing protein CIP73 isoform X1 [Tripterygium wilfordii]|uniref:ubiquitin-like domain-containing protein CIP73 isoform X1 n=1 Tax=Tripterygium wilfordii TaxID=458696 RepID=UPI0018F83FFE|nr:ubiquitin-like domain-containing protein CIP73 isoform X1 [Tripterygium wilfordii]XP_038700065.1 ubiquitin-like domain-containing protein CIP73 isoform X1 [Tripterygium wilfordii]XP_038700066.1 ubiquitin-like domain-containing protein CIP73 isoform X1 [Tripterygium wilfordii]XP_038700067.1 ubiquitin-like domain-containing protein CIP73 isoform X1 [Tripterygium wilfordii]XP_038700068.1 ubiquitin-like domain-containing protein CIP73 isoform X1 [Tripterygium wilfordii]
MGSTAGNKTSLIDGAERSETTIEIKIKTLDSQTYTLRVDKQMTVPALKERIASVTGVLSEQQRLIFHGRVLKDDQLLSAYHVEDGHTLHMVVRQPVPPTSDGLPSNPAMDSASDSVHGHGSHIGQSVVIETFNVPDHGDGVPPEISQILSAVLGSFGFSNARSHSEGVDPRDLDPRTGSASLAADASQLQPEQASMRGQTGRLHTAFGLPTAASLGPLFPRVITDSLTTLSLYASNLRREFDAIGGGGGDNAESAAFHRTVERDSSSTAHPGRLQVGLPTPASLAEVMLSTRQLLSEQVGECFLQLESQLEDQENVIDPSARMSAQSSAWRMGVLLHNLGAFILELGRTTMSLRLGQAPSEAVVNAGPAVFISPYGPNPLMVQPLPFQGTSFSGIPMGSVQPGSDLANGISTGFLPRRIDIQIRRGSSADDASSVNREGGNNQQQPGQRNPATGSGSETVGNQTSSRVSESLSLAGEPGVRMVPIRTVVAAVPGSFSRLPPGSSENSIGLLHLLLGRFQNVSSGLQTGQQTNPESVLQQPNNEDQSRGDSLSTPAPRQPESSDPRNVSINILSAGGTLNSQEHEGQIPNSVFQLLRNLFPGGEIHVEDGSSQGTATGSVSGHAGRSNTPADAEPGATDEGIFLSNLLHEIIPFISQHADPVSTIIPQGTLNPEHVMTQDSSTQVETSDVGSSRRQSDTEPSPPSSKRQKTE